MENKQKLYSTKEAAALLGVTPSRIRQLIMAGRAAPYQKIGRVWLFTGAEIERVRTRVMRKPGRPRQEKIIFRYEAK